MLYYIQLYIYTNSNYTNVQVLYSRCTDEETGRYPCRTDLRISLSHTITSRTILSNMIYVHVHEHVHESSVGLYLLLPIPNPRGNHPVACSGKPNVLYCTCMYVLVSSSAKWIVQCHFSLCFQLVKHSHTCQLVAWCV